MTQVLDAEHTTAGSVPRSSAPHVRTAVGVIVSRFPRIDETFILREIDELERQGQPVVVVPILREDGPVIHEEARPWLHRAFYTPFISPGILRSNVAALFSNPRRYLSLLVELILGTILHPSILLRTLALFPKAVHLARVLPALGIRHVHSHFATHATTMAYVIAALSDITYSFTVHGPDVFVQRALLAEKIRGAKFIRSVSVFNKAFLAGLFPALTEGKIQVIHCGVEPEVYERELAQRPPSHRPSVLSVSALSRSRGVSFLLEACAQLIRDGVDLDCTIVSAGGVRETARQAIRELGVEERVRIIGPLPQHEVARLMGAADIFVLPSIIALDGQMDGIPISLMEAMAAGKPVVASAISGIPELVSNDHNGILVDATHTDRVAVAIRRLIEDPAFRSRLGHAGQRTIRDHFDVRQTARRLVELFDRYRGVNDVPATTAGRIASLDWNRLGVCAIGIRRVRDTPGAAVAEVTVSDGVTRREVIVRRLRDTVEGEPALERARREFETLSVLRHAMGPEDHDSTEGTRCTVPRVLMFDERHASLVVERVDGHSLRRLIDQARTRGRVHRLAIAVARAGEWLKVTQRRSRSTGDGRHILTALVVLALEDLKLASAGDRQVRRQHHRIVEVLRALESRVASQTLGVVGHHGNFTPENIFLGTRRIEVVDLSEYREGLPLEDVARLLIDLEVAFSWPFFRLHLPKLRTALFRGWSGPSRDADPDQLRLLTLTTALRLLAHDTERRGAEDWWRRRVLRNLVTRAVNQ